MQLTFFVAFLLHAAQIELGNKILDVEIADTRETCREGLMGREILEDGRGMLFVFEKPQILYFWMKNTKIPLSIAFFDENRQLIEIEDMFPLSDRSIYCPKYKSSKPALYALEVNQGWFEKNGIEPSMKFSFFDSSN